HTSDQVTLNSPMFSLSPSAFHTAGDPSTMLFAHGGSKLCSLSQPCTESHSSTTLASTDRLFPLMRIILLHRRVPSRRSHPVDSATTSSLSLW
uniref:Uncharacterized protein n=1 Tax=Aegilops tauschii subsp. strangulata TaxID=200361 RepID=A0A452YL34_AEGTS